MSETDCCRVCGQIRPADAPSGLCPACLLKAGLAAPGSEMDNVTILFGPASSSVLQAFGAAYGKIPPVLLRDADSTTQPGPVIRPSSPEIPDAKERSARLQLFGEIARGGMGAVLKGRDADLGRDLAVKILLDSHRDKPEMVRRFIEEAQIAGQLQHPGIVPVYELGAFGDRRPYFAMKLVKGQTLAHILAARTSPSDGLPRLLSIFESICQTMAYAHARGVIHRDLKPSNVMVGSFGEVQVMDWGLAKVLPRGGVVDDATAGQTKEHATVIATASSESDADLSQPGSILGTPAYMAPEQARGEIDLVDERADVFALGSIFCELLTGQPAFTGRNGGEIQRKAARGELADAMTRLDRTDHSHDSELIALCKTCLAPEPEDRPKDASEIAKRISLYHSQVQDRLRQSEIARAEEQARAEEATKRATVERHRFRLTIALAASVGGMILLGGGGWAYTSRQQTIRQAATERVVTEAIDKVIMLRGQAKAAQIDDTSKWSDAVAAANVAKFSMEAGAPTEILRGRVLELLATLEKEKASAIDRAEEFAKDTKLFDRLDGIRASSVEELTVNPLAREKFDQDYARSFTEFGIDIDHVSPEAAAHFLKQRELPEEFASRLDDWAIIRKDFTTEQNSESWKHLVRTAMSTDNDPWRNFLRSLIGTTDIETVHRIASEDQELMKQSARSLYLLAHVLQDTNRKRDPQLKRKALDILKRAWRLCPSDYLICRELSEFADEELDQIRFATAAVSVKPESKHARVALAIALEPLSRSSFGTTWHMVPTSDPSFGKLMSQGDRLRRRQYVVLLKGLDGHEISVGPIWHFDPKEVDPLRLAESIAELRGASRLAPDDLSIQSRLADSLVMQGNHDEASRISSSIAQADPHSDQFHLAQTFYLTGETDRASELLQQQIEMRHGIAGGAERTAELCRFLGCIYHATGRKPLAFAAYREEFKLKGENCLDGVGLERLLDTGTLAEVIKVLRDQVKKHSDSVILHEALARLLERQGKVEEANAEFDKIVQIIRNSPPQYYRKKIGMIYLRQGRRDDAIVEFQNYIEICRQDENKSAWSTKDERDASDINKLAWDLATDPDPKFRDGILAVEFATKACELTKWKFYMYLDTLAAAYAESGDFESALKWQSTAVEGASESDLKEEYARLRLYQQKKPYNHPAPSE